jgi:hypothetical protein
VVKGKSADEAPNTTDPSAGDSAKPAKNTDNKTT